MVYNLWLPWAPILMLAVLYATQKTHLQFLILVLMGKKWAIAELAGQVGQQRKGIFRIKKLEYYWVGTVYFMENLALSYPKHLCRTCRTCTFCCGSAIFHGNWFWILHFSFGSTFYTISCCHNTNNQSRYY